MKLSRCIEYVNTIQEKKKIRKLVVPFQNGGPKPKLRQILYLQEKFPAKKWKTAFPWIFFNEIWLTEAEHKYKQIAEKRIGKSYFVTILGIKQILNSALILVIYVNYLKKYATVLKFFSTKKCATPS